MREGEKEKNDVSSKRQFLDTDATLLHYISFLDLLFPVLALAAATVHIYVLH